MSQQTGCGVVHLRTSKLAAILLAYVFFCLVWHSQVFAEDAVAPINAAEPEAVNTNAPEAGVGLTTMPGEVVNDAISKIEDEDGVVDETTESQFVLAPIPWGGDVSASFSKINTEGNPASLQASQNANLRAITYIWQPWLAQARGSVGVVNNKNTFGKTRNKDISLSGDGEVALLPYSRFPFSASYYAINRQAEALVLSSGNKRAGFELEQHYQPISRHYDSVISYNKDHIVEENNIGVRSDKINSRLNVRHDYRSSKNSSIYAIGYGRNANGGEGQAFSATSKVLAKYMTRLKYHYFEADTINTDSEYANSGLRHNQVTARHTYRPDKLTSVETSALASQSELLAVGQNFTNTRNLQLSSNASWQPDAELPFYVSGSLRGFGTVRNMPAVADSTQGLFGVARVNYESTPNLSYQVSETIGFDRSNNRSATTTITRGGAIYSSDSIKLGSAFHKWNASGGLDYQTNSKSSSNLIKSGKAQQGLRLNQALGKGAMDFSLNQILSVKDRGNSRQNGTLTHNSGLVWKPVLIKSVSGSGSITLVDTRSFGNKLSSLQSANLAIHVQHRTTVKSGSLVSTASILWNANNSGLLAKTLKLGVGYNHQRAFNVVGLRYSLSIDKNQYQTNRARNGANLRGGYTIDQRLEYAVGRAYIKLKGTMDKKAEVKRNTIVIQVGRTFGQL